MRRQFSRAVPAGIALALLLAACGDDGDTSTTTAAPGGAGASTTAATPSEPVTFTLTIENVSAGTEFESPVAPGIVLAHDAEAAPIFTEGQPAPANGLESLAEDGDPTALATSTGAESFEEFEGYEAGPLMPGNSITVEFTAEPGQVLTLANMLGQSNDWFFASLPGGIALWDASGAPITGDITAEIALWDAGTEADQPLGEGADQAPRQEAPNTGDPDPDPNVRKVADATGLIKVTIAPKA